MDGERKTEITNAVQKNIIMQFSRSSGPGGQNVNKRSTRVTAWVPVKSAGFFTDGEKRVLEKRLAGRLTVDGDLVVRVQDTRSQAQNRELAAARAVDVILSALEKRKPRKATRVPRAADKRRLEGKKAQSEKKKRRRGVSPDSDGEA